VAYTRAVTPSLRTLGPLVAVAFGLGCTSGTGAPAPPTSTSAPATIDAPPTSASARAAIDAPPPGATSASPGGVRPDEGGPPEPVRVDVIAKICGVAACSGPLARVRVFYHANAVYRYAHDGDLQKCSHPPTTVFDQAGKEVGGIAQEPIVRGSAREKEVEARRATLFGDAKHVVTFDCAGKWVAKGADAPK
jgi:hypothetical protein